MTITLKLSVNGPYRATAIHTVSKTAEDGSNEVLSTNTVVAEGTPDGPGEATLPFQHEAINTYEITETQLGTQTLASGDVVVAGAEADAADDATGGTTQGTGLQGGTDLPGVGQPGGPDPLDPGTGERTPAGSGGATGSSEPAKPDFGSMTIVELRDYAAAHDISLTGLTLKDDIVAAVSAK